MRDHYDESIDDDLRHVARIIAANLQAGPHIVAIEMDAGGHWHLHLEPQKMCFLPVRCYVIGKCIVCIESGDVI